jgi:OmpA-OmpF porin, OOP family
MKKHVTIFLLVFASFFALQSQNVYHPWILGVSTNYTDFNVIERKLSEQFNDADWMGRHMPTMIRAGRMLNSSFTFTGVLSTVSLDVEKLNLIPLDKTVGDDYFWKIGGQIEYKFANGYILSEKSWFDPYIYTGLSGSTIDQITYLSFPMGVGFNVWLTDYVGINFQGSYDYQFDFNDYMHYSTGIVVRFGNMSDKDDDGIPNKYDQCPEIFGVPELEGCPDYDGDGIVDSLDRCPKDPGPVSGKGCPDFDSDGIPDVDDECPCDPGTAEFNGCPDSDGDGIPDRKDDCPFEAGPAGANGCPDADGDGVPDKWDMCPNVPGPKENAGCPWDKPIKTQTQPTGSSMPTPPADEVEQLLQFHTQNILFDVNSARISKSSMSSLNEILRVMKQDKDSNYTIYGYTDDSGPSDFNLYLSKERANAVKKFFTDKGINPNRLDAKGFGQANAIAPNDTPENREKNRRVEIKLKK